MRPAAPVPLTFNITTLNFSEFFTARTRRRSYEPMTSARARGLASIAFASVCAGLGVQGVAVSPHARAEPSVAAAAAARLSKRKIIVDARARTSWDWNWDGRSSGGDPTPSDSVAASAAPTKVYWLVRHGQATEETPETDAAADGERKLTDLGRKQASFTARRLKELIPSTASVKMTHSTMVRAKETADIIAAEAFPNATRKSSELIREGAPVRPEPDTWRQAEHVHVTDAPRIEAGFRETFHRAPSPSSAATKPPPPEHEIVVCHGNVIRYSVLRALQLPPDAWLRIGLYNGSITRVEVRGDGGVSLRCLGDAGYMTADMLTHN